MRSARAKCANIIKENEALKKKLRIKDNKIAQISAKKSAVIVEIRNENKHLIKVNMPWRLNFMH